MNESKKLLEKRKIRKFTTVICTFFQYFSLSLYIFFFYLENTFFCDFNFISPPNVYQLKNSFESTMFAVFKEINCP